MIDISNCPVTGLKRKITGKVFVWDDIERAIKIRCAVSHFTNDSNETLIEKAGIKSFIRDLVAKDGLVNPANGTALTQEQIDDPNLGYTPIKEYDYYLPMAYVPIIINTQILNLIALRDSQGKFDNV